MIKKIGFVTLIVIIVFFSLVVISTLMKDVPTEVMSINYTFMVKNNPGINLDVDKLNFGGGSPGTVLERKMNVSSSFDSFVHIESMGPGIVVVDMNDFDLEKNNSTEVVFSLEVPSQLSLGTYEGTVFVSFYER